PVLWLRSCRAGEARAGVQRYVRLAADGVRWGLRLGGAAGAARDGLRAAVEEHAEHLFRALRDNGALASCRFGLADVPESLQPLTEPDQLLPWARGRTQEVSCARPSDDPLLRSP